ncbi:unnamed protein product [Linum tenue]|uniref:F-box domain-containing protein n=1 Tax=Linum tenue TaxID=586396 RepID=A0AAV0NIG9_9ROSI|nr:unnamed protein product [Linum tenue]
MELGESTVDRISNVPANAIEQILTLLPIKDAARTSILSRNWRHHWRSIPQLVFDGSFAPPLPITEPYLPDEKKVMMDIYEALLLHDGPVTKFELSIPGFREDCPRICKLIPHVGSKGVHELALRFSKGQTKLPSSLFTACSHLTVLKLQHCSVGAPSSFVGFRKLVVIELEHVIMPEDFLQKLQPECPLLQELRVLYCSRQEYKLNVPSLKVLFIKSSGSGCNITIQHAPVLSVLSLTDGWTSKNWLALFASLPELRQLTFAIHSLKLGTNNAQPSSEVMGSLQELLEAEERHGICCLQHLEEFDILDSQGRQVELDLVRLVLATAPQLRTISIKRAVNLSSDKVLGFLNELVSYKRISKDAEVKYV